MTLNLLSSDDARRLRDFLTDAGYSEQNLHLKLGLRDPASGRLRNLARLQDVTREPNCINTLLRWFWTGSSQDASEASKYVPDWFISLALQCGLLRQNGKDLVGEVLLLPTEGLLLAADHSRKFESADPELVLWTNPTSRLLSRFTVRRPSRATLDLGTGNGIQALSAASHSEKVVATDLNPRAVNFAAFNARLNGIENVTCRGGDGFEPVSGEKFDLIVSNPPYYISPTTQYLFCENPMDLDQLCRRLVREASAHLHEGGYFQMLCEWAEIQGQPWQERLKEWFVDTGCDAWVIKHQRQDPSEYAEEHVRQTAVSPDRDAEHYASYMAYYRERNVKAIHGGVVAMHRRPGQNWMLIEEIAQIPRGRFGESVLRAFEARDFLQSHPFDEQLLQVKPKVAADARLEQVFQQADGGWQRESVTLRLGKGFEFFVELQPVLADFLKGCSGNRTVAEAIAEFAAKVNAPRDELQRECLKVVRKLIERGFLLC